MVTRRGVTAASEAAAADARGRGSATVWAAARERSGGGRRWIREPYSRWAVGAYGEVHPSAGARGAPAA